MPTPAEQATDPNTRLSPGLGRDPQRTPMPWDTGAGVGFTTGRPRLPLGEDNLGRQVAAQRKDPGSMLTLPPPPTHPPPADLYPDQRGYEPARADGDVLAYRRTGDGGPYLVALNLGPHPARLAVPGPNRPAEC